MGEPAVNLGSLSAIPSALHSVDSSRWYTPPDIVDRARRLLGVIELDPASDRAAQSIVQARNYHTEAENGLLPDWSGAVFLNPPSPPKEWWLKLMRHVRDGDVRRAVFVAYSLEQLSQSQLWSENTGLPSMLDFRVCIPRRRVPYLRRVDGALVRGAQPPHASAIVGINIGRGGFAREFGEMGWCS